MLAAQNQRLAIAHPLFMLQGKIVPGCEHLIDRQDYKPKKPGATAGQQQVQQETKRVHLDV